MGWEPEFHSTPSRSVKIAASLLPMKTLSPKHVAEFNRILATQKASERERSDYLKWLNCYLRFCEKRNYLPGDPASLPSFMQQLALRKKSHEKQGQAAAAVSIYLEMVARLERMTDPGAELAGRQAAWREYLQRLTNEILLRHYSQRTLQAYRQWARKFMLHSAFKHPAELDSDDARRFLTDLAVVKHVAASTQNQVFNALLFFYRHVLKADYDLKDSVVRARRTKYIPVVLTRAEVDRIMTHLPYPHNLVVKLMYGCGLRLFECLNLRVHCLNMTDGLLTVHDGKGRKDRTLPLPKVVRGELEDHLRRVEKLLRKDLDRGYAGVFMPGGMDRKWKNASVELGWQWVFPAKRPTLVPESGEFRRYHLHEGQLQESLRLAKRQSGICKRVTSHVFRHSFASHLLQANYDIRTIQEMLGHADLRTTMIYTHTVKSRTLKERESPLDFEPVRDCPE